MTHWQILIVVVWEHRRNEVTAREGIDTVDILFITNDGDGCRNEVTAREGIDTEVI